jgi:cell division protein FtsA
MKLIKTDQDIIVGLDIGTTKIAVLIGTKNEFGKIEILSIGKSESIGVQRGVVVNIQDTIESIKIATADAVKNLDIRSSEDQSKKLEVEIGEVIVGIAGQHIKSLQHHGKMKRSETEDEVNQKDVDSLIDNMHQLIMEPGEEIIHVIPQDYMVDKERGIKNPIGHAGSVLEGNFHIITGHVSAIKNIYKCVSRAGLSVEDLQLEPLASSASVLSEEEKEAGVVLVDIGGGTTDIAIFHDGIIRHTAVIPFGGNVISEDIKEGCNIIKAQAESLKVKYGSALAAESQENEVICIPGLRGRPKKEISVKSLANIIQARMEEILELVLFEIKNSGYEKKLAAGIVVTGGGAQLKHITQLVEFITGMDCRIGTPNEHLGSSAIEVTHPMFATGVGLVMKGFEKLEKEKGRNKTVISQSTPSTPKKENSPEPKEEKDNKPIDHSSRKRGSLFENLLKKGKEWLKDDID